MKFATLLLLAAVGCTHAKVVKLAATTNYYKASHLEKCHQGLDKDSPRCKPCESIIQQADTRAATANTNDKLGYLPPAELVEIDETIASLESCP